MGNQQVYTPFQQPFPVQQGIGYTAQTQINTVTTLPLGAPGVVPVNQNNDCCSPNVPPSLNCCTPSYAQGIANSPFYGQETNQCCNMTPSYSTVPNGTVGYGQVGNFQSSQSLDQWCCGPANYNVVGSNQQKIVTQQVITEVIPTISVPTPAVNSFPLLTPAYQTEPVFTQVVIDPVASSVIETDVYFPVVPSVERVNPFLSLPQRIISVIQDLGSINPLRGSVLGRLETAQYIPQKQAFYQGQWAEGYMQGFGRLYFDSGAYFQGEFVNGLAQTKHGLFIYPDGSYYIGGVDRNVANGVGQFNYRKGRLIYKGQFLNDQPDGHGVQMYSDGSKYEGQFRFGKKEGRGHFIWRDGTVYSGQFENGFMQGEGIHKLSIGEVYEGQFRKNKRHGKGKLISSLGTYTGGFKRDKKDGQGEFIWNDGRVFQGIFHDSKPDGPGSMTINDGTIVYGIWINGTIDQDSLTTVNPHRGSQINPPGFRASLASIGSIDSIQNVQFGSALARASQLVNGPPTINLTGGMLAGGFTGLASPFVNQRGSIVSVIGGGGDYRPSSIPRGSTIMLPNSLIPPIRGSSISVLPINGASTLSSVIGRRATGYPPLPARTSTITTNIQTRPPIPNIGSPIISRPVSVSPISGPRSSSIAPQFGPIGVNPLVQPNRLNTPNRVSSLSPGIARTSQFIIKSPGSVTSQVTQQPFFR